MTVPITTQSSSRRDDPRVLAALYGTITLVILFAIIGIGRRTLWPLITYHPTPATVDSSVVEEGTRHAPDRYTPRVYYSYSLEGHVYRGTRVTPTDLRGKRPWAEQLVALYPRGTRVTTYYDPAHPEKAFLRHSAGEFWGLLALFGGWLVIAVSIVTRAVRKRRLYDPANL